MPKNYQRHAPKLPSYLYIKRGVFYYRYRISNFFSENLAHREIRVSLRTGFKREAIAMAKKIHPKVSEAIEALPYSDDGLSNDERIVQIRQQVRNFVDELLAEPNKKAVSERDIRLRLNGFLKYEMDRAANCPDPLPELECIHPDGSVTPRSNEKVFDSIAHEQALESNSMEHAEDWFEANIIELAFRDIFERAEITPDNAIVLAKNYQRTKSVLNRVIAARLRGDYAFEQPFYAAESVPYPRTVQERPLQPSRPTVQPKPTLLLSELINRYCTTQLADKAWEEHTLTDHRGRLENILDILHDKPAEEVSREDMRRMRDVLMKLPPSRKKSKKYQGKSVAEILKMDYEKTLSATTVNIVIDAIASMFAWAIREQLLTANPAIGLKVRNDTPDIDKKEPFSIEDIQKIFFSGDYTPRAFRNPAYYWVPLIGLYSGMRLEEICQLRCKDVYEDEGIFVFDINAGTDSETDSKKLKTKNAIRKVPVHPYLISKGLLDYLEKVQKNKKVRLFPELKITPKSPKYGKQVGKNFAALIQRKGIEGKKSFHSLRHSFAQFFKERGMHDETFRQVFGHQQTELASTTYGSRIPSKICFERIISRLSYTEEDQKK